MWDDTFLLLLIKCTLGVFPALAFVADFPPVAPEFHQRTHSRTPQKFGHNWQKIFSLWVSLLLPAATQKLHNYEDFMKLSQKATEISFLMLWCVCIKGKHLFGSMSCIAWCVSSSKNAEAFLNLESIHFLWGLKQEWEGELLWIYHFIWFLKVK